MVGTLLNRASLRNVVQRLKRSPAGLVRKLARARQIWRDPNDTSRVVQASLAQIQHLLSAPEAPLGSLLTMLDRQAEMLRLLNIQQQVAGLSPLDRLRTLHPWPNRRPALNACNHTWHNNGRDLIDRLIVERGIKLILEIGTFLGHSALRWLAVAGAESTVICVDPFLADLDVAQWGWGELAGKNLYYAFLANCWEHRHQLIPIRGYSPRALLPVHFLGVQPELIYIDGGHYYKDVLQDLETCHRYWPHAVLCGDDWRYDKHRLPPASVQEAVQDFARANNLCINVDWNTWALTETPMQ